jgi:hypothetical protein
MIYYCHPFSFGLKLKIITRQAINNKKGDAYYE